MDGKNKQTNDRMVKWKERRKKKNYIDYKQQSGSREDKAAKERKKKQKQFVQENRKVAKPNFCLINHANCVQRNLLRLIY